MTIIENFYKNATDEDWETMAVLRKEAGKDPVKLADFKKQYGFTPDSIRPYEQMHFHEFENRRKDLQTIEQLAQENAKLKEEAKALHNLWINPPPSRMMSGERQKATFYATTETLEMFDSAVDRVSDMYGYKKYIAAAFILDELLIRFKSL